MMQKGMFVSAITQRNQTVEGVFCVSEVARQSKNNGESYWAFNINDASGDMPARRWPMGGVLTPSELPDGSYVHLAGIGAPYNGQMQLRVDSMRVLSAAEASTLREEDFLPPPPYDGETALQELLALADSETRNSPWNAVVHEWFDNAENRRKFSRASAARSVHHSGRGGLAVHTLEVCRLCAAVAAVYPDVDRPTLICSALFHDIGKLVEMETGTYETTYTPKGKLIGHIVLGVAMLIPVCARAGVPSPLQEHFFHLILSHHGTVEHGAVKAPATREAFILAQADILSARLNTMEAAMSELAEGAVTARDVFGVSGPVYRPVTVRSLQAKGDEAGRATAPRTATDVPGPDESARALPRRGQAPAREAPVTACGSEGMARRAPARGTRIQEVPRGGSLLDLRP